MRRRHCAYDCSSFPYPIGIGGPFRSIFFISHSPYACILTLRSRAASAQSALWIVRFDCAFICVLRSPAQLLTILHAVCAVSDGSGPKNTIVNVELYFNHRCILLRFGNFEIVRKFEHIMHRQKYTLYESLRRPNSF